MLESLHYWAGIVHASLIFFTLRRKDTGYGPQHFLFSPTFWSSKKGFSQNTSEAYRNDLSQFWEFLQNGHSAPNGNGNGHRQSVYDWRNVDIDTLNNYIQDLRVRKGYRDATTARKVASIKSFFGFLSENGSITEGPGTESLGSPRVGPVAAEILE